MPDPWEYPWFAAWDLAFHCVTLAHIDPAFAKAQLILLLREWYMHPNGQMPGLRMELLRRQPAGARLGGASGCSSSTAAPTSRFLARIFHKLLINFTWWVDNKDHGGNNLFQGGFMGLDNIAPLDRSTLPPDVGLPGAGRLHRVDGDVRAGPAGHGAAPGAARPVLRGRGDQVLRALPDHRRRGQRRRPVGRAGRLLLRRAAPAPTASTSRSRSNRWSAWCRSAPRCPTTRCIVDEPARLPRPGRMVPGQPPGIPVARSTPRDIDGATSPAARDGRRRSGWSGCWTTCSRRRGLLSRLRHPGDLGLAPGPSVQRRGRRRRPRRSTTNRPNPPPTCSAATPTGAARSGCR